MDYLLKEIIKYVNNKKAKYAIMIDGEWGCGKTYFIKNQFVNKYDNAVYVSLYGLSSIEQLNEKIYYEIVKSKYSTNSIIRFFKKIWNKSKIFKILLFIPYLIICIIKKIYVLLRGLIWLITYNIINLKFNINISKLKKTDFNGAIELFSKINNYILVFDDLERSSIPFNEVLGYISDLVENRSTKCIIISNEKEIEQINKKNYELKILTAIHMLNDNKDLKLIKEQVNNIYDETNVYKKIKEKIIGKTYLFKPSVSEIYDNIVSNYNDKEFSFILNESKKGIMQEMDYLNYHNVRTLISFFELFGEIYNYIYLEVQKYDNKKNAICREIAISTFCTCICYKKGINIKDLLNNGLTNIALPEINSDDNSDTFYFRVFDFIVEYILTNEIIKSNCSKTLDEYYEIAYKSILEDDPLNDLERYWEKSEKEITEIFNNINNNIKNKKYDYKLYSDIIFKLSLLKTFGYNDSVINKIITNMKKNIKDDKVTEIYSSLFFEDSEVKSIYDAYYNELNKLLEENKEIKNINQNKKIMCDENWGIKLYNNIKENNNTNNFYFNLDVEQIINNIKNSDNTNIYHFKYYLDKVDSISRYINIDYEKLKELERQIQILYNSEKDVMKKRAIKLVLDKLDLMNNGHRMWNVEKSN